MHAVLLPEKWTAVFQGKGSCVSGGDV